MAIDKSKLLEKPWERWNVSQKEFEEFYSNMMARETNVPKVGDPAPHFEAERLDAKGKRTGENFKFGGPGARPVAFVFGSYTWPPFRDDAVRINAIYDTYKSDIDFYCVYVKEAHPEDNIGGYQTKPNTDEGIIFNQHTNIEERAEVAQVCMMRMNLEMPMVLDDMDDTAEKAYVAYPDRLYLMGADGRVAYRSEMGPVGFIVDDWENAINGLLVKKTAAE